MKNILVLPTYNERKNVSALVPLIFSTVPDVHVVIADDNSPDGTADLVRELQKKYPNLTLISQAGKQGLGKAYINAFNKVLAANDVRSIIMMDADLSHPPKYLPEMLEKSKEYSVVIGSRYTKGGGTVGWELWRRILSFCGNIYCRTITRMPIYDCTGGFNIINADLLRKIDFTKMDMSGYAFIMELKYLLYTAGARFYEVPIIFVNRAEGESKISSHIISEGILAPWKMVFKRK
jgi:dolichol-phosphate mannosyltransferase